MNFLERVQHKNLNKKSLEALIKSGALDSLQEERGKLLSNIEQLTNYHQTTLKASENQDSLFALLSDQSSVPQLKLHDTEPARAEEKLLWEKELLGLYISGHPLDRYKAKFTDENSIKKARESTEGTVLFVAGILEEVKSINTKKGELMAFAKLTDYTGTIECVIFSRIYQQFRELLKVENCVAIKGKISHRNGEPSVVVESLKELN